MYLEFAISFAGQMNNFIQLITVLLFFVINGAGEMIFLLGSVFISAHDSWILTAFLHYCLINASLSSGLIDQLKLALYFSALNPNFFLEVSKPAACA